MINNASVQILKTQLPPTLNYFIGVKKFVNQQTMIR